jgi:flagellar hook-associated protein 3 FlgL
MRVTQARLIDMSATATAANQAKVGEAAARASTGLRVTKPSDDPAAWMAAQRASAHKNLTAGASDALKAGRDRLDLVDGALASIGDAVAQVRTLAVQGASAGYSASDRAALAQQVRSLFAGALAAANTQTPDGEYVLAGTQSLTPPFSSAGAYAGDATARQLPATETTVASSTMTGSALTAASGIDVLPLLDRVATALAANDVPTLQASLGDLATAIQQVSLSRSRVGGMMNVLDASLVATQDLDAHLTTEVSNAVEADIVGAASELAKATSALEASRAVTSHIVALLDPRQS